MLFQRKKKLVKRPQKNLQKHNFASLNSSQKNKINKNLKLYAQTVKHKHSSKP